MKTEKINFGEQIDKSTGEITYKNFQACLYVPDGEDTPYKPKVCLNLKLGDNSFTIMGDSIDDPYLAIENLYKWLHNIKYNSNINDVTVKSIAKFYAKQKQEAEDGIKKENSVIENKNLV